MMLKKIFQSESLLLMMMKISAMIVSALRITSPMIIVEISEDKRLSLELKLKKNVEAEDSRRWSKVAHTEQSYGREQWEFDPKAGSPKEQAQVEKHCLLFKQNRFKSKQSSDLLIRMQVNY